MTATSPNSTLIPKVPQHESTCPNFTESSPKDDDNTDQTVFINLTLGNWDTEIIPEYSHVNCLAQAIRKMSERQEAQSTPMDNAQNSSSSVDIYEDLPTIRYLRTPKAKADVSLGRIKGGISERNRVLEGARHYWFDGRRKKLYRKFPDGSLREVPEPSKRRALVQKVHEQISHFGERRTRHVLQQNYWWMGLTDEVHLVLSQCMACQRVKAVFNASGNVREALKSLPIKGFLYRWSLDYAKPTVQVTTAGNQRVLIIIEHYTRFVLLIPVADKEAKTSAEVFTRHVLSIWGSPAEVLTDQGSEFKGEFDELLSSLHIDHRQTQSYSPQGNGAAERVVQIVKSALSKLQTINDIRATWDNELWKLALAYNSTPQESTQIQPFVLMFAQQPSIPEEARSKLKGEDVQKILESKDAVRRDKLVADLVRRSRMLEVTHIHAGLNLCIAQHKDYVRYMSLHDQGHPARSTGYKPGDYVMVWQKPKSKLDARAKPIILQVIETLSTGVVILRGADGATVKSQASHLSPCPIQVHPMVDARDRIVPAKEACRICGSPARASKMLLCDSCNGGYHIDCLTPPLSKVPEGAWFCPECGKKKAAPTAEERMKTAISHHQQELAPNDSTTASLLIRGLMHSKGVLTSMAYCEQIIEESNPENGLELFSEKSPAELEKEQRALIRKFISDCLPKEQRDVHATASMSVARGWLWTILHERKVPETWQSETKRLWIVDVSSSDVMIILALLLDHSGVYPFVLALKCQQVTKQFERPGLDCYGKRWEPLITLWALQGRIKLIGSSPNTWLILSSTCTELVRLFSA